jgi:VanZ family protein
MIRILRDRMLRSPRLLALITALLFAGMLAACLWPYLPQRNTVSWLPGGRGISFGRSGIVVSSAPFHMPGNADDASCSLELWLQRDPRHNTGTILASYSPDTPRHFSIGQWFSGLTLRSPSNVNPLRSGALISDAVDVFPRGQAVLVTITSGPQGTRIYVDGILRKLTPDSPIINRQFSGQLVLGTAASLTDCWRGQMLGLAIYGRRLNPEHVLQHSLMWTSKGRPDITEADAAIALYLFEEGNGLRVRNQIAGGVALEIPERFVLPAKPFLSPPSPDNREDIFENIAGYIPLGFSLCALLASLRIPRAPFIGVLACAAVSLMVECLQYFTPTRDSDLTDVITNTLGAALGVVLFRFLPSGDARADASRSPGIDSR